MTRTRPSTTAAMLAAGLCATLAHAQVHQVAYTTDDDEPFGNRNTDAGISVNGQAVVTTSNMRVSLFNRSGSLLDSRQVGGTNPTPWPFKRVDGGVHPTLGPSRFFDPSTVYHPQTGRLWIVYSEENATGGTQGPGGGTLNNISPLHIAVSKDMVSPNVLDSFGTDDWWFYTGTSTSAGNGGPAFDLQQPMIQYIDGGDHDSYPGGPISLLDKPHIAVDEQAAYVTSYGSFGSSLVIIPTAHGSGLSILDGDQPAPSDMTFVRMQDLPAQDAGIYHSFVQEPYDQLANAQFIISVPDDSNPDAVRLAGVWYESTANPARWWYSQHKMTATTFEDMEVDSGKNYSTSNVYEAVTPDTTMPDVGMDLKVATSYFASAVLVKINNTDWRIFAVHNVRPVGENGIPEEQWAVQWYVIDPHLAAFRTADDESTAWQPEIVAMGRLDSGEGDRIHPVIMVTPQAVAFIEYTFTSDTVWPQVRRAQLNSSYTDIVPNSEVTIQTGPANGYYTTASTHRDAWADFADAQADPANPCAFWSTHTLVHQNTLVNDRRDVWLFEFDANCGNANLNDDLLVDLYDMAMFNDLFAAGARRVDMNTDGETDSTDSALYNAAYDAQKD